MAQKRRIKRFPIVDVGKYGGKWIVWDRADRHVVATGRTFQSAYDKAVKTGEKESILEKVPRADRFWRI